MVQVVSGDAVHALANKDIDVLGHQVNCDGLMGAGIARQIVRTWSHVRTTYRAALKERSLALGRAQFVRVGDHQWVANLAGQRHPRRWFGHYQTDYDALETALTHMAAFLTEHHLRGGLPYGIGCGLAGGDWGIVQPMIARIFTQADLTLFRLDDTTVKKTR